MSAAARTRPSTLAALAVPLAAACAGAAGNRGAGDSTESAPFVRLLDRIAEARVRGDLAGLDGALSLPSAGEDVLREEFADPPGEAWFDDRWREALEAEPGAPRRGPPPIESEGSVRAVRIEADLRGLHRILAAPERESFLVTARMLVPRGSTGGGIWALPQALEAPDGRDLASALREFAAAKQERGRRAEVRVDGVGRWAELSLFVPPEPGRRSLSLSLLPSTNGALVDRVVVRRLSTAAALHLTPRPAFDRGRHPLGRVLSLPRAGTCEALLVPRSASVAFDVELRGSRPRLAFVPGAVSAANDVAVELSILAGGEAAWSARIAAAPLAANHPFEVVEVDLSRHAGRRVALEISARSTQDSVAFLAAPALLFDEKRPAPRNLLLISLDTLRADHLGCYGDARGLSPAIDALAAEGIRFENVWTPASYTLPAHMSLFTGQHPLVHGAWEPNDAVDPRRVRPLALRLRERGHRTAAFTGGGLVQPLHGFGDGFELYGVNDPCGLTSLRPERIEREKPFVLPGDPLAPAVRWLEANAGEPFFLFVHTYLVHNYAPDPRYLGRLRDPGRTISEDRPLALRELAKSGDREALHRLQSLYAATVAQADEVLVGRLLRRLDELGIAANTVVCLVSDHGEEILEHGNAGHGKELYVESARVPWILRGPGAPAGVARRGPVELADAAATLAALLGLPPDPLVHGRDRLAASEDEEDVHPLVLAHRFDYAPARRDALVLGPWKLMRSGEGGGEPRLELFRVDQDPLEREDLAARDAARARALSLALDLSLRRLAELRATLPGGAAELSPEVLRELQERMRELGYLEE